MTRYINDDVALQPNSRKGVYLPKEVLTQKVEEILFNENEIDFETYFTEKENPDWQYCLDMENIFYDCDEIQDEDVLLRDVLLGYHSYKDKFSWIGCMIGGDGAISVYTIFYYDGQQIRGYVPVRGNMVNLDANCALMGEYDCPRYDDDEFDEYELINIYVRQGLITKADASSMDLADIYVRKYGYTEYEDVDYNWDAIEEDIKVTFGL